MNCFLKKFKFFCFVALITFSACKKKKEEEKEPTPNFEKSTLLTNVGTNIILPGYELLYSKIETFETSYSLFIQDKTINNLSDARSAWKEAYLQWNKMMIYEFGPAMDYGLRAALGTFPTDTTKVLNNITNGGYVLGSVGNVDAVGFSVFDFLLFRFDALNYFQNNGTSYSNYGTEIIQKMKNEVSSVLSNWNSTYLNTFKTSTGTESTSSFSLFVNEFNRSYEISKWTKIGIPIGKQSLGIARPEYIEARNSAYSIDLLLQNMKAMKQIFNGDTDNSSGGVGFDDYLNALDKATLTTSINSQFSSIISDIEAISATFEVTMNSSPQTLDALYTKVHNLTIAIKTDMAAAFGVMITYQDNDGD